DLVGHEDKLELLQRPWRRNRVVFADFVELIEREVFHDLHAARRRPGDFGRLDRERVAQANLLAQGRLAEASAGAHGLVNGPQAGGGLHSYLDSRAERRAIRLHAFELQRNPVPAKARILIEYVAIIIARIEAAHHFVNVLVAVVVEVGERDA